MRILEVGDSSPSVVRFDVRVQPRASRSEVAGAYGAAVKIRLSAPAVEGAANKALIVFLARRLGVSKSAVTIAAGQRSRSKTVQLEGVRAVDVRAAMLPDG
jgi:uncharacterized protein (TIGR00251 family)